MRLTYHPGLQGDLSAGGAERRRFRRFTLDRPVKLHCHTTGRYLAGTGLDASSGGALIRLQHDANLAVGETITIGIARDRQQGLMLTDDMVEAHVVRCLGHGEHRYLALQFDVPVFLAEAG
jgi:hypothetical protein